MRREQSYVSILTTALANIFTQMKEKGFLVIVDQGCYPSYFINSTVEGFFDALATLDSLFFDEKTKFVAILDKVDIRNQEAKVDTWDAKNGLSRNLKFVDDKKSKLKIGTITFNSSNAVWAYKEMSTNLMSGYCVDLAGKLSSTMNFDFELVEFLSQEEAVEGVTVGQVDILVAPIPAVSDLALKIAFVSPHFIRNGISIVGKQPKQERSGFRLAFTIIFNLEYITFSG